jgi:hypothetical protein
LIRNAETGPSRRNVMAIERWPRSA